MLPNFLIIGAPRAGTTWIAKNIREHPQIFLPRKKELHFFDREYHKGIQYYLTYFSGAEDEIAVGEATPEYLYIKEVPARIHRHIPNVKLILSLRNPVDRVYSRYWHAKARFKENKHITFEQKVREKPIFLEEGFYYDHLTRYLEFFDKENILILFFEDIKKDPDQFLRKIYRFIGVDEEYSSPLSKQRINAAAAKGSLAKSRILSYLYRGLISINAGKPAKLIEKINSGSIPPMKPETREWLISEVYREKNHQLAKLIGKDLSDWDSY